MSAAPPPALSPASTRAQKAFETGCVEFFAEVVQLFGVPRSVGQIYGLLYASPVPLGFSDIIERLDISKGSASQGLQLLRSLGAINEADISSTSATSTSTGTTRVSRGVTYEPELSLRQLITGVLREQIAPIAAAGTGRLKRLRQLAEETEGEKAFYLGRVKQLETWRRRFNTVAPVLSALLGPKKNVRT